MQKGKNTMKRSQSFVKLIITLAIIAAAILCIGIVVLSNNKIVLRSVDGKVLQAGTERISCNLVNRSLHSVKFGTAFYLEREEDGKWTAVSDKGTSINFELGSKTLRPLASVSAEFPVSVYSDMMKPGDYRIVFPVQIGNDALNVYCNFTVSP